MGGSTYARPVYGSTSSAAFGSGMTSNTATQEMNADDMSVYMTPKKTVSSNVKYPIVVMLDVTGSNTNLAKVCYDKAPMMHGQIEQQGYLPANEFEISFSACGDAYCDSAPLQIGDFAYGIELDNWIKKIYLEGGGGGQLHETYELAAYYYNNKCNIDKAIVPFFFFIADEAPYADIFRRNIKKVFDEDTNVDILSSKVFKQLDKKFHGNVFVLLNKYCGGDWVPWIIDEWRKYIPEERIIRLKQEKSIIDVMLGIIAMTTKTRDLDKYTQDLVVRGQNDERISSVKSSLQNYTTALTTIVDMGTLPEKSSKINRNSSMRKL
jgi:hypothetical protein